MTAFASIGRTFSGYNAAHITFAKGFGRPFLRSQRVAIGDPIDHRDPDSRHRTERGANPRAPKNQEPVPQAILYPEQHATLGIDRLTRIDHGHPPDLRGPQRRKREKGAWHRSDP